MRYALVTETYPPEVNGVALTLQGLEQGLRQAGRDVDLIRPRQAGDAAAIADSLLVRGSALPRYPGLRFGLPAPIRLGRRWQARRPDAVYIATEGPLGWSALGCARRLGIPVATGLHTRFDEIMPNYGAAWLRAAAMQWMRRFHNRSDATLVATRELQTFLRGQGFERVRVLSRAVDGRRFDPSRRDPGLRREWRLGDGRPERGEEGFAAIYVGRIAPEKNLDLAVQAFRRLQQRRPHARFVLVGDGPSRERLLRQNPDFIYCGVQRDEELARHFASGDLFLFPSRSETFGNVTLEAMASGVTTVAFAYGAAGEHLRNGENGAAVDDDEAFIAAAVSLACDDARRQRLGRQASRDMRRLQPERVIAEFDALLAGLARARRPTTAAATGPGRLLDRVRRSRWFG